MSRQGTELDPFGTTTDATAYVPRPACEEALTALEEAFDGGARQVAFTGPSGIGKTQLLRVLGARLQEKADLLILPYAGLEFDELCFFALGLLGEEGDPDKAAEDLRAAAERRASGDRFLILALDDASGLSKEAARELIELTDVTSGALRILVVPVDDPRAGRVLATLGKDLPEVRLSEAMTEEESNQYVKARLARRPPPPEIFGRFDEGALRWIHRESGGIPREVHHLCLMIQRGLVADSPDAFNRREQWLEIEVGDVPTIESRNEAAGPQPILSEAQTIPIYPMPVTPPILEPSQGVGNRPLAEGRKLRRLGLIGLGIFLMAGLWWGMSGDPERGVPSGGTLAQPEASLEDDVSPPIVSVDSARSNAGQAAVAAAKGADTPEVELGPGIATTEVEDAFPVESMDGLVRDLVDGEDPLRRDVSPPVTGPSANGASDLASESTLIGREAEGLPRDADLAQVEDEPSESRPATAFPAAPAPGTPQVRINVNANPWAKVEIDGRDVGSTPLARVPLAPGVHVFRLTFPDGHTLEAERTVDSRNRHFVFGE